MRFLPQAVIPVQKAIEMMDMLEKDTKAIEMMNGM